MKKIITATFLILLGEFLYSQDLAKFKLYNPEDGKKSYNRENVIGFLKDWRLSSLDPQQYKEQ